MDWSGAIPMKIKMATDGVYDEGPEYWFEDEDPWLCESDLVDDRWSFSIQLYNNGRKDMDGLIFLLAYKGGEFSHLTVGGWMVSPGNCYDNSSWPFGPAGNRPGDGESALYNSALGVVFVRVDVPLPSKKETEIEINVDGIKGGLFVHYDIYGFTIAGEPVADATETEIRGGGSNTAGESGLDCLQNVTVEYTVPASHDVTWDVPCYPSAAEDETWSRVKALFER